MKLRLLAAAAALSLPAPAAAVVMIATYTGEVTSIFRGSSGLHVNSFTGVALGDAFTAVFNYDSDVNPTGIVLVPEFILSRREGSGANNPVAGSISFNGAAPTFADEYGSTTRRDAEGAGLPHSSYDSVQHLAGMDLSSGYILDMSLEMGNIHTNFLSSLDHTAPLSLTNPSGRDGSFVRIYTFLPGGGGFARHTAVEIGLRTYSVNVVQANPVPEPSTWAFMIVGFGAIGAAMRSARRKAAPPATA